MGGWKDADGYKRGAGPYSRDYAKFDRPKDKTSIRHLDTALMAGQNMWEPGPVSERGAGPGKKFSGGKQIAPDRIGGTKQGGGPPRYRPKSGPITNGAN